MEQNDVGPGVIHQIPQMQQKSRIVEFDLDAERHIQNVLNSLSKPQRSDTKQVMQNMQTVLQETMQTSTATKFVAKDLEGDEDSPSDGVNKPKLQKSASDFLEMKLAQMKRKHKQLQLQLSEVSSSQMGKQKALAQQRSPFNNNNMNNQPVIPYENMNGDTNKQTNTTNLNGQPSFFNFNSLKNEINKADTLTELLKGLSSMNNQGKKDIEVHIQKSNLGSIVKTQLESMTTLQANFGDLKSEKDSLSIHHENLLKEATTLREQNAYLTEELKSTKGYLGDTRVELERMKTHYDILERRYIELLKKKQEVKIINKETFKEVIFEKPIEIIKHVMNSRIVKRTKEVRKIIKPKADEKHTVTYKLHVVNREIYTPTVQNIEKVVEIPKREVVEVDRVIEKPIVIEKPVYIERKVEVPHLINQYIQTPVRQEVQSPIIHQIRTQDPYIERENQNLQLTNSHLKRDLQILSDENRYLKQKNSNFCSPVSQQSQSTGIFSPTQQFYQREFIPSRA